MDWKRRIRECLEHALEKLSATSRRIIELRYTEELSHRQIAARLNKTMGYVAGTLARAEQYFRDEIEAECSEEISSVFELRTRNQDEI